MDQTRPAAPVPDLPTTAPSDWLDPSRHRWALRHVEEFLPSHRVAADPSAARDLAQAPAPLADLTIPGSSRGEVTLAQLLATTETDAWLVLHDGVLVDEQYHAQMAPSTSHLLMSVTKTVVGMVAGILADQGLLAPEDAVTRHVPELATSGYAGATVRDVLDMRSGVLFGEDYADPTSHIRAMEAAIGWRRGVDGAHRGLHEYLGHLTIQRPHGGPFEYRSAETDVLGWVCERAAGAPMASLISELVWRPMGAERDAALLCDSFGASVHDGGLAATARDVARFGQLLLDAGALEGHQVVPREWIAQIWSVDPDVRRAFAASAAEASFPGGWYRNQSWVTPGPHGDLLLCLGIYGQLIRVDPATRTVMVKLSSWDAAQDPGRMFDTLRACDAVAGALSGRAGPRGPRFGVAQGRSVVTGRDGSADEFAGGTAGPGAL